MNTTSWLQVRVHPRQKAVWVLTAQAAGLNLSEWTTQTLDAAAGSPVAVSRRFGSRRNPRRCYGMDDAREFAREAGRPVWCELTSETERSKRIVLVKP